MFNYLLYVSKPLELGSVDYGHCMWAERNVAMNAKTKINLHSSICNTLIGEVSFFKFTLCFLFNRLIQYLSFIIVVFGFFSSDIVRMAESSIEWDRQNKDSILHILVCFVGGDIAALCVTKWDCNVLTAEFAALFSLSSFFSEQPCAVYLERTSSVPSFIFLFTAEFCVIAKLCVRSVSLVCIFFKCSTRFDGLFLIYWRTSIKVQIWIKRNIKNNI